MATVRRLATVVSGSLAVMPENAEPSRTSPIHVNANRDGEDGTARSGTYVLPNRALIPERVSFCQTGSLSVYVLPVTLEIVVNITTNVQQIPVEIMALASDCQTALSSVNVPHISQEQHVNWRIRVFRIHVYTVEFVLRTVPKTINVYVPRDILEVIVKK